MAEVVVNLTRSQLRTIRDELEYRLRFYERSSLNSQGRDTEARIARVKECLKVLDQRLDIAPKP